MIPRDTINPTGSYGNPTLTRINFYIISQIVSKIFNLFQKSITDKSEELHHWQRKCDNNDKEVRSLRLRIEHLKQELGEAQDDLDNETTTIRRLERTNEELSSQCEGLQVQVEHLTSR